MLLLRCPAKLHRNTVRRSELKLPVLCHPSNRKLYSVANREQCRFHIGQCADGLPILPDLFAPGSGFNVSVRATAERAEWLSGSPSGRRELPNLLQ